MQYKKEFAAVAVLLGLLALLSSWVIAPYRLQAAEKEIVELKSLRQSDRELAIRTEERLIRTEDRVVRIDQQVNRIYGLFFKNAPDQAAGADNKKEK